MCGGVIFEFFYLFPVKPPSHATGVGIFIAIVSKYIMVHNSIIAKIATVESVCSLMNRAHNKNTNTRPNTAIEMKNFRMLSHFGWKTMSKLAIFKSPHSLLSYLRREGELGTTAHHVIIIVCSLSKLYKLQSI